METKLTNGTKWKPRLPIKITRNPVLIKYVFIYKLEPTGCLCIQTRNG